MVAPANTAVAVRGTWFLRALRALRLVVEDEPEEFVAGSDFAETPTPQKPAAIDSMSALGAFPWVKGSVDAVAGDLAGLPLVAYRGTGANAEQVPNHPSLLLFEAPSTGWSGELLRRQLVTDYLLAGNAYALMLRSGTGVSSLIRMHPQRVQIAPASDGSVKAFVYDAQGSRRAYAPSAVLHIRGASWEDTPDGLYGQGLVRALTRDLNAELAAQKQNERQADTGRPDAIVSPKNENDTWGQKQVADMKAAFEKRSKQDGGGIWVLGGSIAYEAMSFSPKDMEYSSLRTLTRQTVLMATGVPPVRVGLETANYATAKEQDRIYWETLKAHARLLDAQFTRVAQVWDPDVRIRHDFASVAALEQDRSERLRRVVSWTEDLGMAPADAAAYEGFQDAPLDAVPEADQDTNELREVSK